MASIELMGAGPRVGLGMDAGPVSDGGLIQMRGIVKTFHTDAGDFAALKGIDVDFHRGQFASVVGKSGSGKSTLVNMITGIDRPTSGTVRIGDT